jgi:predicted DNA-binding protein
VSKADRFKQLDNRRDRTSITPEKEAVLNNLMGVNEQENGILNRNTTLEQKEGTMNMNTQTAKVMDSEELNTEAEQLLDTLQPEHGTTTSIDEFKNRRRPTVEETHKRYTFLMEKELLARLDKLARKAKDRGYKTFVLNEAIRKYLDEEEAKTAKK